MPVQVEEASGGHPISLKESGRDGQSRITNPRDGAFAGTGVHKDEGQLAQAVRNVDKVGANPGALKFVAMNLGGGVVANHSDIVGSQPPPPTSDERRSYLAAGHNSSGEHFHFGAEGGELGELHHGVGGVFADAQNVEGWLAHKFVVQSNGRVWKCKAGCDACESPIMMEVAKGLVNRMAKRENCGAGADRQHVFRAAWDCGGAKYFLK